MPKTRRRFGRELKLEAASQLAAGRQLADVARSLGIDAQVLQQWLAEVAEDPTRAFPGICVQCRSQLTLVARVLDRSGFCSECRAGLARSLKGCAPKVAAYRLPPFRGPTGQDGTWRHDVNPPVLEFLLRTSDDLKWLRARFEHPRGKVFSGLYSSLARQSPFYFRGQIKEYFASGRVQLAPAWVRRALLYYSPLDPEVDIQRYNQAVIQWTRPLHICFPRRALNRETRNARGNLTIHKGLAVTGNRPHVLAVMQQYGFPTHLLDVTSSLDVALWFATHRFDPGTESYTRQTFPPNSNDWPVIYLFFDDGVIDFRRLGVRSRTAVRLKAQRAAFLLGGATIEAAVAPGMLQWTIDKDTLQDKIVAIFKISPSLGHSVPGFATTDLFPPSTRDPLNRILTAERPSGFIPYA